MKITKSRTVLALAAVTVGVAALATALPATAATQARTASVKPVTAHSNYLALGDSIVFGFREAANKPTPDYKDAASFVGYPERIASEMGLKLANAACPGETSASLVNNHKQSYACETKPDGSPGYRAAYPLHEKYSGSQLAYGVKYLKTHKNTRLVTLMVGANDGFLCQATTADHCMSAAELGKVVKTIETNVSITLKALRATGYKGQIVIVNYYSLNYSNALDNAQASVVNNALDTGASKYNVRIASTYQAFRAAARQAGGNSCTAGLLTTLSTGGCGVHPSVAGQEVLAGAVMRAIRK